MMSVRNLLSVCVALYSLCLLVHSWRGRRTTARGGLQSDDECKKSLSVCVCVALYSLVH